MSAQAPLPRSVVIGGGAAGLSAAILLAAHGRRVTVVEAAPHPAPLLQGFTRKGLHFDTGFHYAGGLTEGGALDVYLKLLGIRDALNVVAMRQDGCELFRIYRKADSAPPDSSDDIALPWGRDNVIRALGRRFPGCETAMESFLADLDREYRHSPFTRLDGNTAFEPSIGGRVLSDALDGMDVPPALKAVLASRCELFGTPPPLASWSEYALVASTLFDSAHTIAGGGRAVADALVARLASLGGEILCGGEAVGIDTVPGADRGRHELRGVRLKDGTLLECEECVYTGHPSRLPDLLTPGALRPAFLSHMSSLPETPGAFMVFGATRSDFLDGRVVRLYEEETLENLAHGTELSPDNVYLTGPPCSAGADGRRPVMICAPFPPGVEEGALDRSARAEWRKREADRLCGLVRRLCPELEDFEPLETATPSTMRAWIHGGTGSIYGVRHEAGSLPLLPHTRIHGLALAGQSIILPGLLGAMVSAVTAAGIFLGYPLLFSELAEWAQHTSS